MRVYHVFGKKQVDILFNSLTMPALTYGIATWPTHYAVNHFRSWKAYYFSCTSISGGARNFPKGGLCSPTGGLWNFFTFKRVK